MTRLDILSSYVWTRRPDHACHIENHRRRVDLMLCVNCAAGLALFAIEYSCRSISLTILCPNCSCNTRCIRSTTRLADGSDRIWGIKVCGAECCNMPKLSLDESVFLIFLLPALVVGRRRLEAQSRVSRGSTANLAFLDFSGYVFHSPWFLHPQFLFGRWRSQSLGGRVVAVGLVLAKAVVSSFPSPRVGVDWVRKGCCLQRGWPLRTSPTPPQSQNLYGSLFIR